ncbi:MAG: NAD(P)-dependent oxidoreductase, partial [Thermodesulfobacteriota bacterium]
MSKKIGFIGLGRMGRWMALNLVKAGFEVLVFDIAPEALAALTGQGARPAASVADLAAGSDWVFLSLPGTDAVREVVFGEEGLVKNLLPGRILVDLGTTDYLWTVECAQDLGRLGFRFADAPVSGMEPGAREGRLTIMFGGEEEVLAEVRPALAALGRRIVHMGGPGSGQLAKLINQLVFNLNVAALAQVLPLAVKLGLDPEKITQVINTGTGRSFASEFFLPGILENRFDRGYSLENAYKDMLCAAEISARRRIPLPLFHAANSIYQAALALGLG